MEENQTKPTDSNSDNSKYKEEKIPPDYHPENPNYRKVVTTSGDVVVVAQAWNVIRISGMTELIKESQD
jgi:hypothetical protein